LVYKAEANGASSFFRLRFGKILCDADHISYKILRLFTKSAYSLAILYGESRIRFEAPQFMPYSVRVNEQAKTITLACWSTITIDHLMDYERVYWGGFEHVGFHHIVDLQLAELDVSLEEGLMLATHATPTDLKAYSGARSAMVAADDEQEILLLAYRDARHAMCSPDIREVKVFRDLELAKAWIQEAETVFNSGT
jgi:hypothetical protein